MFELIFPLFIKLNILLLKLKVKILDEIRLSHPEMDNELYHKIYLGAFQLNNIIKKNTYVVVKIGMKVKRTKKD